MGMQISVGAALVALVLMIGATVEARWQLTEDDAGLPTSRLSMEAPKGVQFEKFVTVGGNRAVDDLGMCVFVAGTRYHCAVERVAANLFLVQGSYYGDGEVSYRVVARVVDVTENRQRVYSCEGRMGTDDVVALGPMVVENGDSQWEDVAMATESVLFKYSPDVLVAGEIDSIALTGSWAVGSNPRTVRLVRVSETVWVGSTNRAVGLETQNVIEGDLLLKSGQAERVEKKVRLEVVRRRVSP